MEEVPSFLRSLSASPRFEPFWQRNQHRIIVLRIPSWHGLNKPMKFQPQKACNSQYTTIYLSKNITILCLRKNSLGDDSDLLQIEI